VHISKRVRLRPPSASPNSRNHGLQVLLGTRSIMTSKFAPSWTPSAYLKTRLIVASKCITKLARLHPPSASPDSHDHSLQVHLRAHSITALKCISTLARLRAPRSHDHRLEVHLQTYSITASQGISEFTLSSFSCTPQIALKHRLQPVHIYPV
jgi:hypothetical protein